MRFTRTKKTRDPNAIRPFVIVIRFQKGFETFSDLVRQDIFFDFKPQARFVIRFNNAFYRTINRLGENGIQAHSKGLKLDFAVVDIKCPIILVVMEATKEIQRSAIG